MPFVEEQCQLSDVPISASAFLDSAQVTHELKKCLAVNAALFASVACRKCSDYFRWLLSPLDTGDTRHTGDSGHSETKTLRDSGDSGESGDLGYSRDSGGRRARNPALSK